MNRLRIDSAAASDRQGPVGHKTRQAGLTLLELMVSLGLGLVLLAGTGTVYLGSRQAYQLQESSARLQEAGRYALETIGRGIRQAGTSAPMDSTANMPADCNPKDPATTCVPVAGVDGAGVLPDTLTVQFYANNDEMDPVNGLGARDCTDGFAPIGTLVANTYALDRAKLNLTCTGSVNGNPVPLIGNIEDFQVLYGIDNDGDTFPSANLYSLTPPANGQVVSVRVCVLVRSDSTAMASKSQQRYLNCNGALGVATCQNVPPACASPTNAFNVAQDTRLRRVFIATFVVRNLVTVPPT